MRLRHFITVVFAVTLLFAFEAGVFAQSIAPNVQVAGAGIVDDSVTILEATVAGPGWIVIHADNGGKPGPVVGYAPLEEGVNTQVVVEIDTEAATPILHAMLHVDEGEVGTYEFPGADGPVKVGDSIVMARFSAQPVVEDEDMMVEPDTMPATGAATSTTLVLAVTLMGLLAVGMSVVASRRRTQA